ncbi:hypothetical protein K439DRAFT_1337487, partial [Ramaria rubella]
IGGLTAYLLCVDMVYAGVVKIPRGAQVGKAIFDIRRGSYAQMMLLGVITTSSDNEECGYTFQKLHNRVIEIMEPEETAQMNLDIFTMEHALCKQKRLGDLLLR